MRINRTDQPFYFFAFTAIFISFYTIVFHVGFQILPITFLITGIVLFFLPSGMGIKGFFILVPLINSLPSIFFNGYPFNLMATVLFLLSGVLIGLVLKGKRPAFKDFNWAGSYLIFLMILWISALFVLLRWSNISMPSGAFLADTPVSPGVPHSPRNSFATIFPVITIFLFSITPFIAALINEYSLKKDKIFKLMAYGYSGSVLIAFFQKFCDSSFMSLEWWGNKMNQYNGGFSDFNGFGLFGGVIFLYSSLKLMGPREKDSEQDFRREMLSSISILFISFAGIVLSGSRTAFIFIIFAFIFLMFSRAKNIIKIIVPFVLITVLFFSGGELVKRLEKTVDSTKVSVEKRSLITTIDDLSNGRVQMIANSIPMVRKYPVSGIGAGNFIFYLKYLKYGGDFLEDLPLNQYLLFLDELGVVGFLSFLFFIFMVLRGKQKDMYYKIFSVFLLVMLVGNSLWLPEVLILFWIILISVNGTSKQKQPVPKGIKVLPFVLLLIFVLSNIFTFSSLHPSKLMKEKGLSFDFGFWTESADAGFIWTKDRSGVLLEMDDHGEYGPLKFFSGAPLDKLSGKFQLLRLLKNNRVIAVNKFTSNSEKIFYIKGEPGEKFFLGIEVDPVFNLKKMGLGAESRDLGVQFFPESE